MRFVYFQELKFIPFKPKISKQSTTIMALNTWHILQSPIPIALTAHNTPPAPPSQKIWSLISSRTYIRSKERSSEIYSLSSWFWQHSINGPCSYPFVTITWTTSHFAEQGKNTSHFSTKYAKSVLCTGYTTDIFLWQKDLQVSSKVVCFSCCSCSPFFFSLVCFVLCCLVFLIPKSTECIVM